MIPTFLASSELTLKLGIGGIQWEEWSRDFDLVEVRNPSFDVINHVFFTDFLPARMSVRMTFVRDLSALQCYHLAIGSGAPALPKNLLDIPPSSIALV
jgi:hypothetical protein